MTLGELLFSFNGRVNRARFWFGSLVVWVVWLMWAVIAMAMDNAFVWTIVGLIGAAMIWPYLAITVKRWHDRDKSAWWLLLPLVPLIGSLWATIELGFLQGSSGGNSYGEDPLAGKTRPLGAQIGLLVVAGIALSTILGVQVANL